MHEGYVYKKNRIVNERNGLCEQKLCDYNVNCEKNEIITIYI